MHCCSTYNLRCCGWAASSSSFWPPDKCRRRSSSGFGCQGDGLEAWWWWIPEWDHGGKRAWSQVSLLPLLSPVQVIKFQPCTVNRSPPRAIWRSFLSLSQKMVTPTSFCSWRTLFQWDPIAPERERYAATTWWWVRVIPNCYIVPYPGYWVPSSSLCVCFLVKIKMSKQSAQKCLSLVTLEEEAPLRTALCFN